MNRSQRSASGITRRDLLKAMAVVGASAGILGDISLAGASNGKPEAIFFNGKFVTLDGKGTIAEAVAVKDGKFMAIGKAQEIKAMAGSDTKMIDLGGKMVVPGLVDGHSHPMEALYLMSDFVDGRYPGVTSVKQLLGRIKDAAAKTPKGEWVQVVGVPASENKFQEKRLPSKEELDKVAPNHPVIFADGPHLAVLNTLGLARMGFTPKKTKLNTGSLAMKDKKGRLTGVVNDPGLQKHPLAHEVFKYYAEGIPKLWNQYGFTSLMAITPSASLPALQEVSIRVKAPTVRYTVSVYKTFDAQTIPDDVRQYEMPKGADPLFYRFAGLKGWVDGENDCRTGLMYEKYHGHHMIDPPGGRGSLVADTPASLHLMKVADNYKKIGMLHATGDRAMDIAMDAIDQLLKSGGSDYLKRIEHFAVFQLKDYQLERAKKLIPHGLKICIQPAWMLDRFKANIENMGMSLAKTGLKMRTLIDAGLEPAASTDVNGVTLVNMNPFRAVYAAVTRNTDAGKIIAPEEAVTVEEALKMWTIWPAKAADEGNIKGTIEVGKLADLTVLSDDVFAIPKEKLIDVKAVKTIVGGKVVYEV